MLIHRPARAFAAAIAVVASISLGVQAIVSSDATGATHGAVLWRMSGYFTILTNLLVCVVFSLQAVRHRSLSAPIYLVVTLSMLLVGIVYHLLLARLWSPEGLAYWADQGLHTVVPVLVVVYWLLWAPKTRLHAYVPLYAALWPMTYAVYALIRGALTGFYAYPFLDVGRIGLGPTVLNLVGIGLAFVLAGYAMLSLARRL